MLKGLFYFILLFWCRWCRPKPKKSSRADSLWLPEKFTFSSTSSTSSTLKGTLLSIPLFWCRWCRPKPKKSRRENPESPIEKFTFSSTSSTSNL